MQSKPWLQILTIAVPVALAIASLVGMVYSTNQEVADSHERINKLEERIDALDERFFDLLTGD